MLLVVVFFSFFFLFFVFVLFLSLSSFSVFLFFVVFVLIVLFSPEILLQVLPGHFSTIIESCISSGGEENWGKGGEGAGVGRTRLSRKASGVGFQSK